MEFMRQQYMVGSERTYLAEKLGLSESQVKIWFQNRRIKYRKSQQSSSGGRIVSSNGHGDEDDEDDDEYEEGEERPCPNPNTDYRFNNQHHQTSNDSDNDGEDSYSIDESACDE